MKNITNYWMLRTNDLKEIDLMILIKMCFIKFMCLIKLTCLNDFSTQLAERSYTEIIKAFKM